MLGMPIGPNLDFADNPHVELSSSCIRTAYNKEL
jgi:hypothetical protein